MTDTPDLRVTIAESMEALATRHYLRQGQVDTRAAHITWEGAQTLRWCAQREAPSYEEMKANLAAAEESWEAAEDNVRDLVDNVRYVASLWLHVDDCIIDEGGKSCTCNLIKMRQSVLDAVA